MFLNVDKLYLTPKIEKMDERYRVELYSSGGKFYGMLYYEPVKRGFINKPISMNSYTCVDATLQKDLYEDFPTITPVGLLRGLTHLISQLSGGKEEHTSSHTYEQLFHGGYYDTHGYYQESNTLPSPEWSGTTHEGNTSGNP